MSVYAISDLHLAFSIDKPMEVFGGKWKNYMEHIQNNWQSLIKSEDLVLIPGDVSWATYLEDTYKDFKFLNSLNGKKIILKGNHDYWWTTLNKLEKFTKENNFNTIEFLQNSAAKYEDKIICGTRGWIITNSKSSEENIKIFEREKLRLILSLEQAKKISKNEIIVCMHYPPIEKNNPNRDFLNIMKEYGVKKCIYGHLHAAAHNYAQVGNFDGVELKLVSCDYINFTPILV